MMGTAPKSRIPLFALLAALALGPATARADIWDFLARCVAAITNAPVNPRQGLDAEGGLVWESQPFATREQLANWRRAIADPALGMIEALHNRDEDLFLFQLSLMPEDFQAMLASQVEIRRAESNSEARSRAFAFLRNLIAGIGAPTDVFLESLPRFLGSYPKAPEDWQAWVERGLARIRAATPARLAALRAEAQALALEHRAYEDWNTSSKYSLLLPMEATGNQIAVTIGDQVYRGVRRGYFVDLKVPASRTESHAGNRLQSDILMEKFNAGEGGANHYPASIGWDGMFYLLDRNHRFALRDPDDNVVVRVPYPVRTATLAAFAGSLLGYPPAAIRRLIEVHLGTRSPFDAYAREDMRSANRTLRELALPSLREQFERFSNPR